MNALAKIMCLLLSILKSVSQWLIIDRPTCITRQKMSLSSKSKSTRLIFYRQMKRFFILSLFFKRDAGRSIDIENIFRDL